MNVFERNDLLCSLLCSLFTGILIKWKSFDTLWSLTFYLSVMDVPFVWNKIDNWCIADWIRKQIIFCRINEVKCVKNTQININNKIILFIYWNLMHFRSFVVYKLCTKQCVYIYYLSYVMYVVLLCKFHLLNLSSFALHLILLRFYFCFSLK